MFNPQLQTGVYSAQPVAAPDGVAAAASLGSTLMDLGETFFKVQSQREMLDLKKQEIAQKQLAEQQALQSTEDISAAVNILVDINANPNRLLSANKLRETVRKMAESGKYSETQMAEINKGFKVVTGKDVSSTYVDSERQQSEIDALRATQQQEAQTAVAFVSQFRVQYQDETNEFFNADGSMKQDLSVEQQQKLVQVGRSIRSREIAETAAIAAMNDQTVARSKNESMGIARTVQNAIVENWDRISALPTAEGLAEFEKLVAETSASISVNPNLLPEDRQSHQAGFDAVVALYRDRITGASAVNALKTVNGLAASRVYQEGLRLDPQLQAFEAQLQSGTSLNQEQAGAVAVIMKDHIVKNPNNAFAQQNAKVNAAGNVEIDGKDTGVNYTEAKGKEVERIFSPVSPISETKTFIVNGQERTQAAIYTDVIVGMISPVTSEQKMNFYGKGGVYLKVVETLAKNPKALENMGPAVLGNQDMRSAVVRSNSEAVAQYLPNVMQTTTYPGWKIVADVVTVTVDAKGYPVLSIPNSLKGGALAAKAIDNVNRLFRLQHESAINIAKVTGDESIVKDTVASQMQALAQYSQLDEQAAALSGLFEE